MTEIFRRGSVEAPVDGLSGLAGEGLFGGAGVHHLTVPVGLKAMPAEMEFWGALGWRRDHQKHRGMQYPGEWLTSCYEGMPRIWLVANGGVVDGAYCFVLPVYVVLNRLAALAGPPLQFHYEPDYWGAAGYTVWSPSGIQVELLEAFPPAKRYGPPARP